MIVTNTTFRAAPWANVLYAMDRDWWKMHIAEVRKTFLGLLCTPLADCYGAEQVAVRQKSSGAGAVALASQFGAQRVLLLGYDCSTNFGSHWHGDHPKGLGNAQNAKTWPAQFRELALQLAGRVSVINCSRYSQLDVFPRGALAAELQERVVLVDGMNGMGDNLHQRAVVRELCESAQVWLRTPWPSLYHDLPVKFLSPSTNLRTQNKNAAAERGKYSPSAPAQAKTLRVHYPPTEVRARGSVLAAMSAVCGVRVGDFSMPVPPEWHDEIPQFETGGRPIIIYRPLVERKEWGGCRNRNPDAVAYGALFESIREDFCVVSVADLAPGVEWRVDRDVRADVEFHSGELSVRALAALWRRAALVFTAPGFAVPLAQAVGTPVVAVFGGYEDSRSFMSGSPTPYLGIDTVAPCRCFSHTHSCNKSINIDAARRRILEFKNEHCSQQAVCQD